MCAVDLDKIDCRTRISFCWMGQEGGDVHPIFSHRSMASTYAFSSALISSIVIARGFGYVSANGISPGPITTPINQPTQKENALGHTILRPTTLLVPRNRALRPFPTCLCPPILNPWCKRARLPSRVRELDSDLRTLAVDKLDNTAHRLDVRIRPDASTFGRDASFGYHSGCFEHDRTDAASRVALRHHIRWLELLSVKEGQGRTPRWTRCQSVICPPTAEY